MDCIYFTKPEEVQEGKTKNFADGVTAKLIPAGSSGPSAGGLVLDFGKPEDGKRPRQITRVVNFSPEVNDRGQKVVELVVIPVGKDGNPSASTEISVPGPTDSQDAFNPAKNPRLAEVTSLIFKRKDGKELKPEDFTGLFVEACEEGKGNLHMYI